MSGAHKHDILQENSGVALVEATVALAPIMFFISGAVLLFVYQYQKCQIDIKIFKAFRQTQIELPYSASGTPQLHFANTVYNLISDSGTVISTSDIQICRGPFSAPLCCTLADLQSPLPPPSWQLPIFNQMIVLKVNGTAPWARSQYMFFLTN